MLGKRLYESPIIKPVSSIKHFQTCSKSNNIKYQNVLYKSEFK